MNKKNISTKNGNKKNENLAVIIGFVLIILVIIFTLLRGKLFSASDNSPSNDGEITSEMPTFKYETISANDLNKKILTTRKKEDLTLLDIRPFDEYIAEHIVDAVNITPEEFPVSSKINSRSQIIVIGINSGDKNIATAVDKLKEEKIENIKVLAGGMDSWKQLIGSVVTYGNPKSFVDQSKVSYLEPQALNDTLAKKIPVFIVDVRTPDEYAKGHITGAINIPFEDLEKRRSDVTERRIIVVGAHDLEEFQAAVQLYDMLLISPFVMKGSMPAWESKGFELVR